VSRPRYHVKAWYSWADVSAGRYAINADYATRASALAAARASDCPLVDVTGRESARDWGVIASRSNLIHPASSPQVRAAWSPRDTLDDPR